MKRNLICILLIFALAFSLAACDRAEKQDGQLAGESVTVDDLALRPDGEAGILYENEGFRLMIPLEYDALLLTETPRDSNSGELFRVTEKASVEAAKTLGWDYEGAGWLFSIGRVDEAGMQELLAVRDMTGAIAFAADSEGMRYVFYHPTDVRFVRENNEALERDQELWTALNGWAWGKARDSFLAENAGLTAETIGENDLDIHLGCIALMPDTAYTLSTLEFGPITPEAGAFDAAPFAHRLLTDVHYVSADGEQAPDGEYAVLSFPGENVRFDFFFGAENFVRQVYSNGNEQLYKAVFADDSASAAAIVEEWYKALAETLGVTEPPAAADELSGIWTEKIAGRGTIEITPGETEDSYSIFVHWGSSATEAYIWNMTGVRTEDNVIRYTDCRQAILTLSEDSPESEEVQYENGVGEFRLLSTGELIWNDETGHAGDDTLFIRAD